MKPRPDLATEIVDGEIIVLDKTAGKVHQLNVTASFVWSCLNDGIAIEEIASMLSEDFDIEPGSALSDAQAVLAQFKDLALVVE